MVDKGSTIIECLENIIKEQQQQIREAQNSTEETKEDDGFTLLTRESDWPNLFGQFYMGINYSEEPDDAQSTQQSTEGDGDDMLFYVQFKPGDEEAKQEVKVFRKTSPNLPGLGDPHVNWEESVYLNMIMHDLTYTLTCAICVRLPTQDLKVLSKTTLNVHASHHMRRMDSKGESSDLSYPNIFFLIDSYDEVFESLSVQEGEIVCVELTGNFKNSEEHFVIFLGSVKYEALLNVYHAKTPLGSKVAQKMSLPWSGSKSEHFEYIRMRGPHGKGYAEMRIGLCRNDLVEHNNINRYRENTPQNNSACTCGHLEANEQIYNPTTTLPNTCPKCTNTGTSTMWSSPVKWFQQKRTTSTLSPNLTYVTLPWCRIMKDVLNVRQKPVFFKHSRK